MSQINFLPETIVEKRVQKKRSRQAFYAGFVLLSAALISSFTINLYKNSLEAKEKNLINQVRQKESVIESYKSTEGLYHFLKIKSAQLDAILRERKNYSAIMQDIENIAKGFNVNVSKYTLHSPQKLELTASTSTYTDLNNFLQNLHYKKGTLDYVLQNEEKGYIEFSLSLSLST